MQEDSNTTASGITAPKFHAPLDILEYLPVSDTQSYKKGHTIYGRDHPPKSIYLVATGKVSIFQVAENGREILLEILGPDELFGESAFLDLHDGGERATVLENVTLMSWSASHVQDLIVKQPRLAIALLHVLAQRNANLTNRIESFSTDPVEWRLAQSLILFSERFGVPEGDGSVRMMPLTHELLSRYVGTSREVVTHCMNRFRQKGYLTYSRQGILLHCDALKSAIREHRLSRTVNGNQDIRGANHDPASATSLV